MKAQIAAAIAERNLILVALDVEAAKAFIAKHGGYVPRGSVDWLKVLHVARCEVATMPAALVMDSRIWLARHCGEDLTTLPPRSRTARAACDLIFPKDLTDAFIAAHERRA